MADRLKEEEEITESKRRDEEEKLEEKQRDELKLLSGHVLNGSEKTSPAEGPDVESKDEAIENDYDGDSGNENHAGKFSLCVFISWLFSLMLCVVPQHPLLEKSETSRMF